MYQETTIITYPSVIYLINLSITLKNFLYPFIIYPPTHSISPASSQVTTDLLLSAPTLGHQGSAV